MVSPGNCSQIQEPDFCHRCRLLERFNHKLTDMLSKTVDRSGKNWDVCLQYVQFAYPTSLHESMQVPPFYLLYRWDPWHMMEATMVRMR